MYLIMAWYGSQRRRKSHNLNVIFSVADYTGVSQMIVQKFVTALEQFSCGMHPVNAAATLQDPPQFLGFTRLGQICETQDGRQLQIVDSSKGIFFLQDPDIIKCTSAKAAHLLGIGSDKVSSDSVRSVGCVN
uniref:Uncharacterized protein n=1 Tax=Spongospora subterranea TaxID=70186 RepID=A0A0H5QRN4_9EUKA|eukprot:CRZ04698.1 hypothetical protein [Spongospora subterranea]